jgi:hypothetical protein
MTDGSMITNSGSGEMCHFIYKAPLVFINFSGPEKSFKIQIENIAEKLSYKMKQQKHCSI